MNMIASTGQLRAGYIRWALLLVPGIILLGMLAGQFAGSGEGSPWFDALEKPTVFPGIALFELAWTIIYGLMGFALALVVTAVGAPLRGAAVFAFVVQLLLSLAWSQVFFGEHQIFGSFVLIVLLDFAALVTVGLFWRVRRLAAVLLLPFLAWLGFVTYLNWEILVANPELDGQEVSGAVQRYEF